jgi:hypothetical protein
MSADSEVVENGDTPDYRDVIVGDIIQLRQDIEPPYFFHVVNNQGIFVPSALAVKSTCEIGEGGVTMPGCFYYMFPARLPYTGKKAFALISNQSIVRLIKAYETFVVQEILKPE